MMMTETQVLFRPDSDALRFLPEGPYWLGADSVSWVSIQHGAGVRVGALNCLRLSTGVNESFQLHGRPGFAFPTNSHNVFVAGVEREVGLIDLGAGRWTPFIRDVDSTVSNTIINDGVVFDGNLLFGCKDLEFRTQKAGLYLWRRSDRRLIQLRNDQICSNGKAVIPGDGGLHWLYDIDSPSKKITRSILNLSSGSLGEPQTVVDLTAGTVFPDGMILTPDHKSLIVALYDPGDSRFGSARQYSLADGSLEAIWTCPGAPRVTCPQLVMHEGRVRLLLTTAVEGMPDEQLKRHPNSGCLFIGDTSFTSIGDQPRFEIPTI